VSFPVQIYNEPEGTTVLIVDQRIGEGDIKVLIDEDGREWTPVANTNAAAPMDDLPESVRPLGEGEGGIDRDRPAGTDPEQVPDSEAADVKGRNVGLDRAGEGEGPDPTATSLPGNDTPGPEAA
jgi:hypothetical protein